MIDQPPKTPAIARVPAEDTMSLRSSRAPRAPNTEQFARVDIDGRGRTFSQIDASAPDLEIELVSRSRQQARRSHG